MKQQWTIIFLMNYILLCILVFYCLEIKSQNNENSVPKIEIKYQIMAKAYEDSIVLRFGPSCPMLCLRT